MLFLGVALSTSIWKVMKHGYFPYVLTYCLPLSFSAQTILSQGTLLFTSYLKIFRKRITPNKAYFKNIVKKQAEVQYIGFLNAL